MQDYAPNFMKLVAEEPRIGKEPATDDGRFYGFPCLRWNLSMKGVWGFIVREDWLKKVGMTVDQLTTIDDIHTMLVKFRDEDPNGNGIKDEVPMSARQLANFEMGRTLLWWGLSYDYYVKDGKVSYGPYDQKYKEAVTTLNQWYNEGLIDPDYTTKDLAQTDAMILNHLSGFYFGESGGNTMKYMRAWETTQPEAQLIGIQYPIEKEGATRYTNYHDLLYNGVALGISKNNKFPIESVQFMDWGYSPEGQLLQTFGIEGLTYEMNDGKPLLTEYVTKNPDSLSIDEVLAKHCLGSLQGPYAYHPLIRDQRMLFYDWQRTSLDRWAEAVDIQLPKVTLTSEEYKEFNKIKGDIQSYRDEMFDKFVTGREPLSNLDAYFEKMKSLGVEEAIALQQAAYDRFAAR
jgi:putative aldouronate transport system substrate-binding protein